MPQAMMAQNDRVDAVNALRFRGLTVTGWISLGDDVAGLPAQDGRIVMPHPFAEQRPN